MYIFSYNIYWPLNGSLLSDSGQCPTTGGTKAVVCVILSVG